MKLLLSGGTGFFGRAFLDYLQSNHHNSQISVCVLTRSPSRFLEAYPRFEFLPWLTLIEGDLLDACTLPRGHQFTHVIHAATEATISGGLDYKRQYLEIVDGTRNILDLAVQASASRFLMVSSGAAYGFQPSMINKISEACTEWPPLLLPSSAYGLGKLASEHMCALYHHSHGIKYSIARCFSFVGPDLPLRAHYAIGNFINDILTGRDIKIKGSGRPVRSYLYQTDLAHWLYTILIQGRDGEIYNVGSDFAISIADLARLICTTLDPTRAVRFTARQTEDIARLNYVPDISKAHNELGLSVITSLSDAILMTANAHRAS